LTLEACKAGFLALASRISRNPECWLRGSKIAATRRANLTSPAMLCACVGTEQAGDGDGGDDRARAACLSGEGQGIKQIARELRLSRNTVRTIVRGAETEHRYIRRTQPLPRLGAFAETLDWMLTADVRRALA
jgi:hypothetical protein